MTLYKRLCALLSAFDPRLWVLAALAVIVLLVACGAVWGDDDPPATKMTMCRGALPSLSLRADAQDGCVIFTVTATDPMRPDYLSKGGDDTFRHVYWEDGDPMCIGTLQETHLAAGRDCDADSLHDACAYIGRGWRVYAITGQSCSQAGVEPCLGGFCK